MRVSENGLRQCAVSTVGAEPSPVVRPVTGWDRSSSRSGNGPGGSAYQLSKRGFVEAAFRIVWAECYLNPEQVVQGIQEPMYVHCLDPGFPGNFDELIQNPRGARAHLKVDDIFDTARPIQNEFQAVWFKVPVPPPLLKILSSVVHG